MNRNITQIGRLLKLSQSLDQPDHNVGPTTPPETGVRGFCQSNEIRHETTHWVTNKTLLEHAMRQMLLNDPYEAAQYFKRRFLPWRKPVLDESLAAAEYYGLTPEAVAQLQAVETMPLPADYEQGRSRYRMKMQETLQEIIDRKDRPAAYSIAPQPVIREEMFTVTEARLPTGTAASPPASRTSTEELNAAVADLKQAMAGTNPNQSDRR